MFISLPTNKPRVDGDTQSAPLQTPSFDDYLSALKLCCSHASRAAQQGRVNAAHGLFQTALSLLEMADRQKGEDAAVRQPRLEQARGLLESCAADVYPSAPIPTPFGLETLLLDTTLSTADFLRKREKEAR